MLSVAKARKLALELPEVEEKLSHGVPTFRVRGRLFAAMREALNSIVVKLDFDDRDALIAGNPEIFYSNDHYRNYPMVLVRLNKVPVALLRELLDDAWQRAAPKRRVEQRERSQD